MLRAMSVSVESPAGSTSDIPPRFESFMEKSRSEVKRGFHFFLDDGRTLLRQSSIHPAPKLLRLLKGLFPGLA